MMNDIFREWQYRIDPRPWRKAYDQGEITLQELAQKYADACKNVPPGLVDETLIEARDMFEELASSEHEIDDDDFDAALELLYDWGDYMKRCWIVPSFG
jgi:hypothetical protein